MCDAEIVEDLNNFTKKIIKNEKLTNCTVNIEGKSEIGDNYAGEIIFFNITGKNEENEEKIYNLVMKTAKRSEALREKASINLIYGNELCMYSKVFPAYKNFCMEVNPKISFDITPKTYLIVDEPKKESLFFENLKSNGYKLHDRKKPWNLEHSLLSMKNYGKYHGISLALKEKKPELFKEFTDTLLNTSEIFPDFDFHKVYTEPLETVMNYLKEAGRIDLSDKYSGILESLELMVKGKSNMEDKLVICHGDCWNNNFMFKYENDEDESVPSKMCFLDFQISSFDTPILDLSYNIYTTCDGENLKNFDLLLKTYHDSLTKTMESLGCTKKPFTIDHLMEKWKIYGRVGVVISTLLMKIQLSEKEDAPDIVKNVEGGKDMFDGFDVKISDIDEYKRRVLDVFIHFGDRFL